MSFPLIIAEKPDQGLTLCSVFPFVKRQGYIEIRPNDIFPEGAYCTWAVGHLAQLVQPESYNPAWKQWKLETLPIIPEKFRYEVSKTKYKQFHTVKKLLKDARVTEIIHAGDAGREGELIIRNIIHLSGIKKPLKRLWISSLTPQSIKEGFRNLLHDEDTSSLYHEAYARACADWLVGMNASRVYSLLLKQKGINDVFSVGRVQTPTLALIVKRELEIENFKPEPFWEVTALFQFDDKQYEGKWVKNGESRLKDPAMAERIAAFCRQKPAKVAALKKERKEFQPPLLFNLSSLQAAANQAIKFPPKKTLDLVQSLYQKGIVSYPRSDSNYVTKGEAETFPDILQKLQTYPEYAPFFPLPHPSIINNKRFVNEKKVSDHYAIIPTEQVVNPENLPNDERKIYDMIVRRLIAAHYGNAVYHYTTVKTLVDGRAEFISKGTQMEKEGWRKVIFANEKEKDRILPEVKQGDKGIVKDVKIKEGKTQPPKRYTEGQLITLMKTAGKFIEDEALEKVMADVEGLGTEATRAGVITLLKERKYIEVKKNQVYATDKAKVLIRAVGGKILASPEMTAKWEQRLREIGKGQASPAGFMEQSKKLSAKIVHDAVQSANEWDFSGLKVDEIKRVKSKYTLGKKMGKCPKCGGDIVDKGNFYGCSAYQKSGCTFTLPKVILGKKISQANVKKLLAGEETNLIKGFKKNEKAFDAKLKLEQEKLRFIFGKEKTEG
ncbi:DNA topoisomerase [Weizmannia acidilactici]|uniref:DNA topoisomerase n=1 Tax=Weizmannia acidilactici TaxID=2607726 RepID=A0A5J4JKN2_9BACI|nr:DNA topoisomerase III [Weizmannia acidilactici]GER68074.1 DNA topoisomerase [Weizmannia acidilactici]GER70917.1 DNA topoisomerase [Weizmannia acidilactici]GER73968.1 DNA topoisomerase [Weizmannia acidilactici]